jgi:Winged helix DNA-binding domain
MSLVDMVDRLRAWTYARQRLGEPARSASDALRAVVAVYATHPTSPLALFARTRSLSADRYRRLDRSHSAVRIPAMRKTLFLVPTANAPRVFSATCRSAAEIRRTRARTTLSDAEFEGVAARVLEAARSPVRASDLHDAAGLKGQELGALLRCLRYEGRVLALAGDSLMMSAHAYVATAGWMKGGLDAAEAADGLSWLADEYLRACGPARVADFAWWAGVPKTRAAAALEAHATIDVGEGLLLRARDEPAFGRVKKLRGTVDLLPKWDAYTMGHAPDGRARFVHPDVQRAVYTPIGTGLAGDGNPVVLVDGQVAGLWSYTIKDGPRVEPFDTFGPSIRRKVDAEMDRLVAFLAG